MTIDIFTRSPLLVLAFLFAGCHEEPSATTDAEMRARIIGTWVLNDGPFSLFYMEKTYAADGTSSGFLLNRQTGKRIDFTSTWEINNGKFSGTVLKSSDTEAMPPGGSYSDTIVKLTDKRWVMIEQGTGRVTFKHRKGRFALF